jgi:zincin-like metallopeptidase toxin 3 of polymorphic toxin system
MKLTPADQKAFPAFAYYVRENIPQVICVPAIVSAMNKIGQLNKAKLAAALKWGSGPSIKITTLVGAIGEFTPFIGSNEIRIETKIVKDFEKGKGVRVAKAGNVFLVGVTLLHELVHWGDDQDGIDRLGEEGAEFETLVYGKVID